MLAVIRLRIVDNDLRERVIRFGHRPVLVVKDVVAGAYRRAIVAADASSHSDAAIEAAAQLVY
jgi:hypothetical protein